MSPTKHEPRFKLIIGPSLRHCEFVDLKTGESIVCVGFTVEADGHSGVQNGRYVDDIIINIRFLGQDVQIEGAKP